MAKERLLSTEAIPEDSSSNSISLRPDNLTKYIGQKELKDKLKIALEAATQRKEPFDHLLLHGPPGLGKTTIAHLIANKLNTRAWVTSGPALNKPSDLLGTLTRMQPRDILFIDEIHRLPTTIEEYLYPAMEDFKIDFTLDSGMHARVVTYDLNPFTLIGATTRAGLLSGPLRSRFGLNHHFNFYTNEELTEIILNASSQLNLQISKSIASIIAQRSRGTPRITLRLLKRVRDYAQVMQNGKIDHVCIEKSLALEGIDEKGLDQLDRNYLKVLKNIYNNGPAGLEAIAASLGEDSRTIEDLVEPYLLQKGLIARTRQGRLIPLNEASNKAKEPDSLF